MKDTKYFSDLLDLLPSTINVDGSTWVKDREEINDQWCFCRCFYKPKSWIQRILRRRKSKINYVKVLIECHSADSCMSVFFYSLYRDDFVNNVVTICQKRSVEFLDNGLTCLIECLNKGDFYIRCRCSNGD